MSEVLKQVESPAATSLAAPAGLSVAASMLDADVIWLRIESYTAYRWNERAVVWTVQGPGEWVPPLTPTTITTIEVWDADSGWTETTAGASPLGGYVLDGPGPYRLTGTAGSDTLLPPAAVKEAFRRLAEYLADETDRAGVSDYSVNMGGAIEESYKRNPAWVARAMQYSGAGDLLRSYRRA